MATNDLSKTVNKLNSDIDVLKGHKTKKGGVNPLSKNSSTGSSILGDIRHTKGTSVSLATSANDLNLNGDSSHQESEYSSTDSSVSLATSANGEGSVQEEDEEEEEEEGSVQEKEIPDAKLNNSFNELRTLYTSLMNVMDELHCSEEDFEKQVNQLGTNISAINSEESHMATNDLIKTVKKLNSDIDVLKGQELEISKKSTEIDAIEKQNLVDKQKKFDSLKSEISKLKLKEGELNAQNIELQEQLNANAQQQGIVDEDKEALEKKNLREKKDLRETNKILQEELSKASQNYDLQYSILHKQLEELKQQEHKNKYMKDEELEKIKKEIEQKEKVLSEVKRKYHVDEAIKNEKLLTYKKQMQQLRADLEHRDKKISEYGKKEHDIPLKTQEELAQMLQKIATQTEEMARIQEELATKEREIATNNSKILQLEKEKDSNTSEIQKLNRYLNKLHKKQMISIDGNISPTSPRSPSYPTPQLPYHKNSIGDYIGIKVSFPADRKKYPSNDELAPLVGRRLAHAVIPQRTYCWNWKEHAKNGWTPEQIQQNKSDMKRIEEIASKNIGSDLYIESINGKNIGITEGKNTDKFSTTDNSEEKFAKLVQGRIDDPLEIIFKNKEKEITVYIQRFDEKQKYTISQINQGCDQYFGGVKKGGALEYQKMDFEELEKIYNNTFKEIEKADKNIQKIIYKKSWFGKKSDTLAKEYDNPEINEKYKKISELKEKLKTIYNNYLNNKISYEEWKIIEEAEKDNREELEESEETDGLKKLLISEIKTSKKKKYIKINFLGEENIVNKLYEKKNKIYIICKTDTEEYYCIPIKPISKEDCLEIKKIIRDILSELDFLRKILNKDKTEGEYIEKGYEQVRDLDVGGDSDKEEPTKTISGLMSEMRNNFDPLSGKPGDAELLTKTTMMIYNVILGLIVLLCLFTIIIHITNIIKFLYQSFIEIGRVQHNNLETGETFRYKLLQYIMYVNKCSLPSLFSSFNSKRTTSQSIVKLSEIVKDFFQKSEEAGMIGTNSFKNMLSEMELESIESDISQEDGDKKCEAEWEEKIYLNPNINNESEKKRFLSECNTSKNISNENSQKEPLFNIFMVMRLFFMSIKLYLAFFMVVVIVVIVFVLLTIVAKISNMETSNMSPFIKQISFMTLLQGSGICFIYIIVSFMIYKFMFLKIYNRYLDTYLHIISIDFELNKIKRDSSGNIDKIDIEFVELLEHKIDNEIDIENKIIDYIENGLDSKKIEKCIIFYVLIKHIYDGKNKLKLGHLKAVNYFINTDSGQSNLTGDVTNNIETTYYSLIPNKYRKVPLQYYKYNNIKRLNTNIKIAEDIRKNVNAKLTTINEYISNVNKDFDDDNYIVNLGWYFLINLIISTIFIGILIITLVLGWKKANSDIYQFLAFKN